MGSSLEMEWRLNEAEQTVLRMREREQQLLKENEKLRNNLKKSEVASGQLGKWVLSDLQQKAELQEGMEKYRKENKSLRAEVRVLNTSLTKMKDLETQLQKLQTDFMSFAQTLDASQAVYIKTYKQQIKRLEHDIVSWNANKTHGKTPVSSVITRGENEKSLSVINPDDEKRLARNDLRAAASRKILKGKNYLCETDKDKTKEKKSVYFLTMIGEGDR